MKYFQLKNLKVAQPLVDFVNTKVLPGLTMDEAEFWDHFDSILSQHIPQNNELLQKRDDLQQQIDDWFHHNDYDENQLSDYKQFLKDIGYLLEEADDFKISVENVDREISSVAGPQLVVPINNARFAINAANARWGSLFDALYGTDMISNEGATARQQTYNEKRAEQVFDFCFGWLDEVIPLENGSHSQVIEYELGELNGSQLLLAKLSNGSPTVLKSTEQFCGVSALNDNVYLFSHHDLHFEIHIDRNTPIGSAHPAGITDIILEAAISTIQDCEDSVAAVDVEDKLQVYNNWFELITGSLNLQMEKAGKTFIRSLNPDRQYKDSQGNSFDLPGRSLMLIRNTGLHMLTDLVFTRDNKKVPEGIVDAMITVLISMHDFIEQRKFVNSKKGSIYIVKPKMHGPDEVEFSCNVFASIEKLYGLPANTIKIGIMDEERRTTVNLKECIRRAKKRVIFINTGFLDRTGDEIHTSMEAGPMLPKAEIKTARWISAYENWNVDTGLLCGLDGVAQIGKGMWAEPDNLLAMYQTKIAQPEAGANCAWVPSPTAATLHALHYHKINVKQKQQELKQRKRASVDDILSIPLLPSSRKLTEKEIQQELENNAQGILGYVVKWIDMGVGCSKVPDIHDTGLMEDRATLRISSQQLANWLRHEVFTEQQLIDTFKRMAVIVDQQNSNSSGYNNMAPECDGIAFNAAIDLVLQGTQSANGYTEDLLHHYRQKLKVG